jgi:hypothetical protein
MTEAVGTSAETVTLEFKTDQGEAVTYTIPSFGYLEAQIQRLDDTVIKLMGLDSSDANVRMPDGTFKKIYQSRLINTPNRITDVTVPSNFAYKNNWFFESFLSPALYIPIDVTGYVTADADKILVKRIILNTTTPDEEEYFNQTFKGKNNITYENLLIGLQQNNIQFFQDEEVKDLPLSVLRYDGTFDVFKYEDITQENPDGTISKRRKYFLNKLTYSDGLLNTQDTVDLKEGDQIVSKETIYKIDTIDTANNAITTKKVSGYDAISIGTDSLRIYSEKFSAREAQIGIGYDERQVVFLKAVDPNFNVVSTEWSAGIGFYSNDLKIQTTAGEKNLGQFYLSEVTDFGQQFISAAKEKIVPAIYGVVPNAPVIDAENLKVVRVNDHKLNTDEVENVNKKAADKVRLNSEIKELDASINKKKEQLSNTKFTSDAERRGVKNELDSLIREKTAKSSLYASIVQELAVLADDKPAALDKPKFRIRGFFEIPEYKDSEKTGRQYPIQFLTEYRYIKVDGSATDSKQYEFTDAQGQILRGTYSNWNEVKSDIRKKYYNDETGLYEWATEEIENADVNNINQLNIPISKGEKVEIRVRSVSEAGWPINPLLSSYSEVVTIEFPPELLTEDEATLAIVRANEEETLVSFQQELDAIGLDLHLSRSFTRGDQYFAHESERIASGFFTQEGNVITLFEKIKELVNEIEFLRAKVEEIKGELSITLINEDGSKTNVQNGDSIDLFAGYYKDFVDSLPIGERKGAIISKVFKILLENAESTPLELISRMPGGIGERLPNTVDPSGAGVTDALSVYGTNGWVNEAILPPDKDYNASRRYDLVPIVNNSIDPSETNTASKISSNFHQSQQLPSQFMYARFTDVGLKSNAGDLYYDSAGGNTVTRYDGSYDPKDRTLVPLDPTSIVLGDQGTFVWNGTYTTAVPNGNGYLEDFCMHIEHPLLNDEQSTPFENLQNPEITLNGYDEDEVFGIVPITDSDEATSAFKHSLGINVQNLPVAVPVSVATKIKGKKSQQLNFRNNWKELGGSKWLSLINTTPENLTPATNIEGAVYPATISAGSYNASSTNEYILPDKFGFTDFDRYLIGKNTCGSYLYMAPATVEQLLVDGTDVRASRFVQNGDGNGIEIPITFQFRMTDYFGEGNTGTGIIGGYDPSTTSQITSKIKKINLTYSRSIGIDVYVRNESPFSFDINVSAKYKRENLSQKTDIVSKKVSKSREIVRVKKSQIKNLR